MFLFGTLCSIFYPGYPRHTKLMNLDQEQRDVMKKKIYRHASTSVCIVAVDSKTKNVPDKLYVFHEEESMQQVCADITRDMAELHDLTELGRPLEFYLPNGNQVTMGDTLIIIHGLYSVDGFLYIAVE